MNNNDLNQTSSKSTKNNSSVNMLISILVILLLFGGVFIAGKFFINPRTKDNKSSDKKIKITKTKDVKKLTLLQVSVNGITISFPSNRNEFEAAGWNLNNENNELDLGSGLSMSGGHIGEKAGGADISFINLSGKTMKLNDCSIDDATFYNSSNKREKIYFVGGLNYNSTEDEIKTTMESLGYKNVEIKKNETEASYSYFLYDKKENSKDYIEIQFNKGKIKTVSVYTSGQ